MTIGATGKFPYGKVDPTDEGELVLAVAYDRVHNLVRIEFGKPVAWMAMSPDEAIAFAEVITAKAKMGKT